MASNVTWAQVHVVFCEQHQQKLDMHCEDCHMDLCLECAKMDHTKHMQLEFYQEHCEENSRKMYDWIEESP